MIDRKIKPEPSGNISFESPKINLTILENSLRVFHVEKNTLPIIQINFIIPSGSIFDPNGKSGLSSLVSMLIDEGAGQLTGLEISEQIEILGSILNVSSSKEFTTISLLTLKENLNKSLEILSLIIKSPNFTKNDFEREKKRLTTQIIQYNDDPSYIASSEFNKIIYNNLSYQNPSIGNLDSVKDLTNNDVKDFYKKNYSPKNSFLIIVGNINKDEIENTLNPFFGNWNNNSEIPKFSSKINFHDNQLLFIDKPDAAQSEIRVGHFSKGRLSKDFYSRTILNSILGGQFSSRINLNLREDKGYTYGANSNYYYNKIGSTFTISTSVKTDNTIDSIKEIVIELENIKETISSEEINFSKSYLIRRYPSLFETYSQVASNLSLIPIFNLNMDYFLKYIHNIKLVTQDDVVTAANENILLNNLTFVVVGNKKRLFKQLDNFLKKHNIRLIEE